MKRISKRNGKKGGRPNCDKYNSAFEIPEINFVILTEFQYNALLERYGSALIKNALLILDEWLCSSPVGCKYKGKNNYASFRSDGWLINLAKDSVTQQI